MEVAFSSSFIVSVYHSCFLEVLLIRCSIASSSLSWSTFQCPKSGVPCWGIYLILWESDEKVHICKMSGLIARYLQVWPVYSYECILLLVGIRVWKPRKLCWPCRYWFRELRNPCDSDFPEKREAYLPSHKGRWSPQAGLRGAICVRNLTFPWCPPGCFLHVMKFKFPIFTSDFEWHTKKIGGSEKSSSWPNFVFPSVLERAFLSSNTELEEDVKIGNNWVQSIQNPLSITPL